MPKEKKPFRVKIQLTKAQYEALREQAKKTGESMSTLVRQKLEGGK